MLDYEIVQKIFRHINLTQNESRVYLALLESGNNTPSGIARYSGIARHKIYGILEQLLEKGGCILQNENPKAYGPVKPKILLDKAELEIASLMKATQQMNKQMKEIYDKKVSKKGNITDNINLLSDPVQIAELVKELTANAKDEILGYSVFSRWRPAMKRVDKNRFFELNKVFAEVLRKTIEEKGIKFYSMTSPEDLNTDLIRMRTENPKELPNFIVRITDRIPCPMIIYDRKEIFITLRNSETDPHTLKYIHISDKRIAEYLSESYYNLFKKATKLEDLDIEELLESKRLVPRDKAKS